MIFFTLTVVGSDRPDAYGAEVDWGIKAPPTYMPEMYLTFEIDINGKTPMRIRQSTPAFETIDSSVLEQAFYGALERLISAMRRANIEAAADRGREAAADRGREAAKLASSQDAIEAARALGIVLPGASGVDGRK